MTFELLNASIDYKSGLLKIFRRNEEGIVVVKDIVASYISYHKEPVADTYKKFIKYQDKDKHGWYRVTWRSRESREQCCKAMGSLAFEADVSPISRLLSDASDVLIQKGKRLYFDLETDSRVSFTQARAGGARILSWAAADDDGKVFSSILEDESDEDEQRLLSEFWEVAQKYHLLCAWNGDFFDFEIIKERTRMLGAFNKSLNRWLFLDHMLTFKRNNLNSAETADQKISLKLNDVAHSLLGEGKHDLDGSKVYETWKTDPKRLEAYNRQDAILMPAIERKTKYIDAVYEVCNLCRVFPESKSLKPTRFVEGYLLALGSKLGHHFRTKWHDQEVHKESVSGAFVKDPILGINKNVAVADFKSMYPSIIRTFNMSPESKGEANGEGCTCPETKIKFKNEPDGILCIALDNMGKARKVWSDKKDKAEPESEEWYEASRLSMAIKVISNSFFGCILNEYSRFFDKEIGESITTTGVHLIKRTIQEAENYGMRVLYSDTDSCMVDYKGLDFQQFVNKCNKEVYPQLIKEWGCTRNFLSLEFEKEFSWIVFSSDGEGEAIKKRYVGIYKTFGGKPVYNPKPKSQGMSTKRGDSIKLARDLLNTIITMLCQEKHDSFEYEKLITEFRERVLRGTITAEDVVQSKSISKNLSDYKTNTPHVRIAKEMEEDGEDTLEGTRIYYYVTNGNTSPIEVKSADEFIDTSADRNYIWTKLVYPSSMRLLGSAFTNVNWRRWLPTTKDKVLKGQISLF